MWGTDWTRAVKLLTYAEGVDAFRLADRLSDSDRTKLMGGTAEPHLRLVAVESLSVEHAFDFTVAAPPIAARSSATSSASSEPISTAGIEFELGERLALSY